MIKNIKKSSKLHFVFIKKCICKKLFSLLEKSPILFVFPLGNSSISNTGVPVTPLSPSPSPSSAQPSSPTSPTSPTSPMSGTSEISGISDGFDRSSFTPDLVFDLCSMDASVLHSYTSSLSNVIGN